MKLYPYYPMVCEEKRMRETQQDHSSTSYLIDVFWEKISFH